MVRPPCHEANGENAERTNSGRSHPVGHDARWGRRMFLKRMLAGVTLLASGATSAAADVDVFAEFNHWMIAAKESACFAIPVPLREVGHAMTIKGDNFVIFSRGFDFDDDANPENTHAILQIGNWVEVGTV